MEAGNNGPMKPVFTKYRLAECVICLVVILFGVLYLNTEILSLWVLLPVFLAAFIAIPVLRYLDENWQLQEKQMDDDMAELIQHEYDHLDGILATMRAIDSKSFVMKKK